MPESVPARHASHKMASGGPNMSKTNAGGGILDTTSSFGRVIDVGTNTRIPILMEMVSAIGRATEPSEVVNAFIGSMRAAYGPRAYITASTRDLPPGEYRLTRFVTH